MRESQRIDHVVIETRMTRKANESSPGIYTLGDGQETKEVTAKRKEMKTKKMHNQTSHLVQKIAFS